MDSLMFKDGFPNSRKKEADSICKYFYVDIYSHPVCGAPNEEREKCGRFSTEKGMMGFDLNNIKEFILYKCDKLKNQCDKNGHLPSGIAFKYRKQIEDKNIAALTVDLANGEMKVNKKVGRNEPCPCGSGKKFKRCCGN